MRQFIQSYQKTINHSNLAIHYGSDNKSLLTSHGEFSTGPSGTRQSYGNMKRMMRLETKLRNVKTSDRD